MITWTNIKVKLGSLIPWERNPKSISKQHAKRLIDLWNKLGQFQSIAVGPELEVYDGHQRLSVLKAAYGNDYEVDARQSSISLSEKEREELVIAAHVGTVGQFDWDSLSGWDAPELIAWGLDDVALKDWKHDVSALGALIESEKQEVDAEPQIDRAAELNEKWQVKTGDLWQVGEHRLLCGDSTNPADIDRLMNGNKARMIFTDPPWNVAIGKDSNPRHRQREGLENDDMSDVDYSAFVSAFVSAFEKVCDGDVYCVLASEYLDVLAGEMRTQGFHWSAFVIWVKDIFVLGRSKYHRRYEPIWYGWHKNNKSSFCDRRDLDDVWEVARPKRSEEHPTMKPVELVIKAVANSSLRGDIVADIFCGGGATMVACANLKRICYANELSPNYCAVILERMTTAFPELQIVRISET